MPTHYALAKRALLAGKHVFVEKPPAMRGEEMEELVALAKDRGLVLMPGHLLLYHPGVRKLKELVDDGALGDVLCIYGNRQNLGVIRQHENALWSLGVHDLSVILWLLGEEPESVVAVGRDFLQPGVEDVVFCYLRFPSGRVAHMHLSWLDPHKMRKMTVVGREKMAVFDDMELERKVTVYEKAPEEPAGTYGEWRTRTGDIYSPKIGERGAAAPRDAALPPPRRGGAGRPPRGAGRARGRAHARPAHPLARARRHRVSAEIHPTAVVHPGTVLGEGVKVMEYAVVGKQPALSPRSTAKREPLPPTVIGDGTIVSTAAIVFAGSTIGARVILGDQSCVRERVTVGDDVVLGRGSLIENDTTVGAMTKIQADAYITAYSTLEERRLHRPLRRDDERQLHGPNGEAPRADQGPDDPPRGADRRRGDPLPGDRDRRGGVRRGRRGRDEGRSRRGRRRRQPRPGAARRAGGRAPPVAASPGEEEGGHIHQSHLIRPGRCLVPDRLAPARARKEVVDRLLAVLADL